MNVSEIINHLGEDREEYYNAVSPPIFQSSNFCFPSVNDMRKKYNYNFEVPFYTRGKNPTAAILRQKLAALEGTEDALVFASGCAAISSAVMSVVKGGDHVICVKNCYGWADHLLNKYLINYGITTTMIDGTDINNFKEAIQPNTKLFYLESPNSLLFELQDVKAVCDLAKKHQITTIIDNSFSTPIHQNPALLGVDIVIHSASKYLGGHSDIVAGVMCSTHERIKAIYANEFMTFGGIISPHDAWLMLRGLRTLPLRVERSAQTADKVVKFLSQYVGTKIEKIIYPFSPDHPQYQLATKQMTRCSGLFSILLKVDTIAQVDRFCDALHYFLIACSWGGHESLVFPASIIEPENDYSIAALPHNLVRLYIGLEEPEVLIADLENGLNKMG